MTGKLLVVKNQNFMVQETASHPTRINIRIDDSKARRSGATLIKTGEFWAYSIEERKSFWGRGSNIGESRAMDVESAYEDMFYHIRSCNHGR